MEKAEKKKFVKDLHDVIKHAGCVVVAHYAGVSVAQMDDLRAKMRQVGGVVKVAKNRLVKIALKETDSHDIENLFKGQTLIACSHDPIAAVKVVCDFAKTNEKFNILGGAMGLKVLDVESLKTLASLPSLDELRAGLLGLISTPATRIAQVVNAPASCLVRVLDAYAQKS